MSTNTTERENPLLQIDTSFRTYLNAYTRSYQNHIVDGVLDYAFESDFAVRQKIMGLGGWGKLVKAAGSQDVSAEAKHLFLKCEQVGPLKYPDIYDIVKKCAERLELVVPIVFVRGDMDKAQVYSVASDIIEPCIVLSKQVVEMCSKEELMFLIGCECGRIQNNHCAYNMAFTYLNYNKYTYRPVERSYKQTVNNQLYTALVQWVKYADITANRAGIICLDKLTYAGNLSTLKPAMDKPNFRFVQADICDREALDRLFEEEHPDIVVNFAAESHVDRSIENPEIFLQTNIMGAATLMDACRKYGIRRYHQISTDEVYGDLTLSVDAKPFTEKA